MKALKTWDYVYVSVQLVLFILYAFPPFRWTFHLGILLQYLFLAGSFFGLIVLFLAMAQLNTNLTPWPSPKIGGTLVSSGLYRFVRHPIYAGILVFAICFALYSGTGSRLILSVLLWLLFHFKSSYEEKLLSAKFPEYEEYRTRTGRFVPGFQL
ncbi:MAG TPA: isoprenylcysteine carboxylmethyltransferase family protein [Saprospiraceae bacterium]|nr:isoprenylcysteine carboxylmethyltransferase family protein [Saprospiraceae bacterium]